MTPTLVNGSPADSIPADDRGLNYGDGVFRTLAVRDGRACMWPQHYAKLVSDCSALRIAAPTEQDLLDDIRRVSSGMPDCALRITVTRGSGGRGYAMPATTNPRRIVSASPWPDYPEQFSITGVNVRFCEQKLAAQPALAGIKHLNRLENVLARAEWTDPDIAEGLLCDGDGHVIEGTRCNLFIVEGGGLVTPDLSQCGVAGVTRDAIIRISSQRGLSCRTEPVCRERLAAAQEVMLVNSIVGIWPVASVGTQKWSAFPVTLRLQRWLSELRNAAD